MEKIPDQTSNAGPKSCEMDWRDWLDETGEFARSASRAELYERRLHYIHRAMDALREAEAMLCR